MFFFSAGTAYQQHVSAIARGACCTHQRLGQCIKTFKELGEAADSVPAETAAVCKDVILPAVTSNNNKHKLRRWNGKRLSN